MKKRILVTGANGQLGKTIKELYSKNTLSLDFTFTSKEILDITNTSQLDNYFENNDFEYCINCAAYTNVEQAEKTPESAYEINAKGVKNLVKEIKKHNIILVHISTDYVFDGEKQTPYTIFDKTNPINKYGKSKLLGELYIRDSLKRYFVVRTSWLYSKNYGHNFYKNILKWAKEGKDLKITTEQIGCPTDTVNLSSFIIDLIQRRDQNFGIKHYCDSEAMSWYDFARKILKENGFIDSIKLDKLNKYSTFAERPKYSILANN